MPCQNASSVRDAQTSADRGRLEELLQNNADEVQGKQIALDAALAARKEAFNPYADMTNEFANLGVATQAAEFQAEESDIALANTLDAMQASGAGAGGATALAQAALKSKRGISASIQQQEAANQKAAAQGAADVQRQKAEGEKYKFAIEEQRANADIDRAAKELDNQRARRDASMSTLLEYDFMNDEI